MKQIAAEMINRLNHVDKIQSIAEFAQGELRNKDIMLYFHDERLQSLVKEVHWDGGVATDWTGDYLMVVDANLGALKSDYYIKRSLNYTVDFTGDTPNTFPTPTITPPRTVIGARAIITRTLAFSPHSDPNTSISHADAQAVSSVKIQLI